MALLDWHSFDYLTTAQLPQLFNAASSGSIAGSGETANHLTCSNCRQNVTPGNTTAIIGAWMGAVSLASPSDLFRLLDGATTQGKLRLNTDGTLSYYRGTATVLGTTVFALTGGGDYFVELKVTIHNSAGTVDVYVDGVNKLSLTGQDTQETANTHWTGYGLGDASVNFDNVYVSDSTGPAPQNDVLGPVRVVALIAESGDGTLAELAPSSGSNNGAMVDDATPDGDTTYNSSATAGDADTYTLPALPNPDPGEGKVYGVKVVANARTTGASTLQTVLRPGALQFESAAKTLTTSFLYYFEPYSRNPATGDLFTIADVNALEVGAMVGGGDSVRLTQVVAEVLVSLSEEESLPDLQKVTQLVLEVVEDEDADAPPPVDACVGGGTVASGTPATDGDSLAAATAPHVWIETTIGGTTYRWAKVAINATTRKEPRVLSFGTLTRALTDGQGGFESAAMTITLSDFDRVLRGLHATQTLLNQPATVYLQDEASIRSGGTPWRVFTGVIRDFRPESDLKYRLVLEDPLTLSFSAFAQDKLIPSVLVTDAISDANPTEKVRDTPVPLPYGNLSDEDEDEPRGTIEAPFISAVTLAGFEDLGNNFRFMIGRGAIGNIQSIFIGDQFSGDPPTARTKANASLYGTKLWAPHMDGWLYDPVQYETVGGYRYTFFYLDQAHPAAELARQRKIPITVNFCGRETTGDGTGSTIASLPLQVLHVLNNEAVQVATGNWLAQKALGSYSLFDTASFSTVKTRSEARISGGYLGAFLIGHSGKQISLRDFIAQACRSGDFDIGINRHGQVMVTMLDRTSTASSAPVFTDQSDILKDSFSIDPHTDGIENSVRYAYRRNYLPALHQLSGTEGSRLPREPFDGTWLSGLQTLNDATSIAAIGETRSSKLLELDLVRHEETADDVAAQRLALRKDPRAEATFKVTVNRGLAVELGDIVKVTHFQGLSATGWTNRRLQVRRHQVDLDRLTVTLTARDVDNLLA